MFYSAYQACDDFMRPVRWMAGSAGQALVRVPGLQPPQHPVRRLGAAWQVFARTHLTHARPAFGIHAVNVAGRTVPVHEENALELPFGTLVRFAKPVDAPQPKVLIVAPLSGHFATLLNNTVEVMLPEHDVYITDWHNARDVPLMAGRFGVEEYIEHVMRFIEAMGPGVHVVAVCQSCVQTLAAAALMAEDDSPLQPRSITLMAGPVDTRVNPTKVNELATSKPITWFERNLIATVPWRYPGALRRVYPGFVQLSAFMSMNVERHVKAHLEMVDGVTDGDHEKVESLTRFYDEYFAVLDLAAEFYLETVQWVFQDHLLARGLLQYRGRTVNPAAIRRTALLTVEGERDDICSLGQTVAAHDLCTSLRPYMKRHHMQAGVGHYGVFSGRRWAGQIYPIVKHVILSNE